MKLFLGEIEAFGRSNRVFLCVGTREKRDKKSGEIYLRTTDFDSRWVKNIVKSFVVDERNRNRPDNENQYYIQLYLMFSLRRRFYYADIKKLTAIGYAAEDLLYHPNIRLYLWEQLCSFMRTKGYCFKIIKSNPSLYEERPYIPLDQYPGADFFSRSGVRMLCRILERLMIRYMLYFGAVFNGRLWCNTIEKELRAEYPDIRRISSASQSGCLFFDADSFSQGRLFLKMGTVRGADIENEYRICQYLIKHTNHEELYLLPYMEKSSSKKLVFPFVCGRSLKKVMMERDLTVQEGEKLLVFLDSLLTDLAGCKIVHRDIHFDNIMCRLDAQTGEINAYMLSDFGCAVIGHEKIPDDTIRQKRKNQYAGSIYRYARYAWDDAAAAVYTVMQNINRDILDQNLLARLLLHVGENVCSLT